MSKEGKGDSAVVRKALEKADEALRNLQNSLEFGRLETSRLFDGDGFAELLLSVRDARSDSGTAPLERCVLSRFHGYLLMLGRLARTTGSSVLPELIGLYSDLALNGGKLFHVEKDWLVSRMGRINVCVETLSVELRFRGALEDPVRFPEVPYVHMFDEECNPESDVEAATRWSHDRARQEYFVNYPEVEPEDDDKEGPYLRMAAELCRSGELLADAKQAKPLQRFPLRRLKVLLRAPTCFEYTQYELPIDFDWEKDDMPSLYDSEKCDMDEELWPDSHRKAFADALKKFLEDGCSASAPYDRAVQDAWRKALDFYVKNKRTFQDGTRDGLTSSRNRAVFLETLERAIDLLNSERRTPRQKAAKRTGCTPGRKTTETRSQQVDCAVKWMGECARKKNPQTVAAAIRHVLSMNDWPADGFKGVETKTGQIVCPALGMAIRRKIDR